MDKKSLKYGIVTIVALIAIFAVIRLASTPDDGIPLDKEMKLAATYLVEIEQGKGKAPASGRVFDFADRNLPRPSIAVPETDPRGARIVYLDQTLPASTLKKVMVKVEARTIEGVDYPAYTYPQFRYNTGTVEIQSVKPRITPKK